MAVLGLQFLHGLFSSCREWGLLFVAVFGLLIMENTVELGLEVSAVPKSWHTDSLLPGMWDLPIPRIKPVSPALTGRFFTTEPPGKSFLDISKLQGSSVNIFNCCKPPENFQYTVFKSR